MEDAFYAVSGEAIKFNYKYCGIERFPKLLNIWERKLKSTPPILQRAFADMHYEELRKLYFILLEIPSLREYIDRIFKNQLRMDVRMPHRLTQIFEEFIQGITYFLTEKSNALPVYHRLMSCGDGKDAFRKMFNQCTLTMKKSNRKDVMTRIYNCYIERLIYDHMYRHNTLLFPQYGKEPIVEQDKGHLHWLEQTRQDYLSCFPNEHIEIEIKYEDIWPVELIIKRTTINVITNINPRIRKETYRKNLIRHFSKPYQYEDLVEAQREEGDVIWFKTPRFKKPLPWVRVQKSPIASRPDPYIPDERVSISGAPLRGGYKNQS